MDWLANKTLAELPLRDEGILVLGVGRPNGPFLGAPDRETKLLPGDSMIIYGVHRQRKTSTSGVRVGRGSGSTARQ